MADGSTNQLKQDLHEWLDRVRSSVKAGTLVLEKDLEYYVRVHSEKDRADVKTKYNGTIPPSLFEMLGYTKQSCDEKPLLPTVFSGTSKINPIPDYILRGADDKDAITWDLKLVTNSLSNRDYIGQIQSYCSHPERPTPIGVLFNGLSLRVFINPDHPKLKQFQLEALKKKNDENWTLDFRQSPVYVVDQDDDPSGKQLIESLIQLSHPANVTNAISYAKRLASTIVNQEKDKVTQWKIVDNLQNALANPSNEIIKAVAQAIPNWAGLNFDPQPEQAVSAWAKRNQIALHTKQPSSVASYSQTKAPSLARQIRDKVADICARKGWGYLQSANVKGFYYHSQPGHGRVLMPQTPGVPANLYISGLAAHDAKKVIKQLDDIINAIAPVPTPTVPILAPALSPSAAPVLAPATTGTPVKSNGKGP